MLKHTWNTVLTRRKLLDEGAGNAATPRRSVEPLGICRISVTRFPYGRSRFRSYRLPPLRSKPQMRHAGPYVEHLPAMECSLTFCPVSMGRVRMTAVTPRTGYWPSLAAYVRKKTTPALA